MLPKLVGTAGNIFVCYFTVACVHISSMCIFGTVAIWNRLSGSSSYLQLQPKLPTPVKSLSQGIKNSAHCLQPGIAIGKN